MGGRMGNKMHKQVANARIRTNNWSFLGLLIKPHILSFLANMPGNSYYECADLLYFSEAKVFSLQPDEAFLLR